MHRRSKALYCYQGVYAAYHNELTMNEQSQIPIWSSMNHKFQLIDPNTSTITCIAESYPITYRLA